MKVGDEGKSRVVPNLNKLLTVTCAKEQSNREDIIKYALFAISNLPDKSAVYATYMALLNLNSHSLAAEICTQAAKALDQAVAANSFSKAKTLLRFFVELANARLLKPGTLADLIYSLIHSHTSSDTLSAGIVAIVYNLPLMVLSRIWTDPARRPRH